MCKCPFRASYTNNLGSDSQVSTIVTKVRIASYKSCQYRKYVNMHKKHSGPLKIRYASISVAIATL